MAIELTGDWDKVRRILGSAEIARKTMTKMKERGMKKTLAYFQGQIRRNMVSSGSLAGQPFAPNAPLTVRLKGSSKPWIDTGDTLNNVAPIFIDENFGFIGLKRGTIHKGKEGKKIADIAEVVEYGGIVNGREIPARPNLGAVLEAFTEEAGSKYLDGMQEVLSEQIG